MYRTVVVIIIFILIGTIVGTIGLFIENSYEDCMDFVKRRVIERIKFCLSIEFFRKAQDSILVFPHRHDWCSSDQRPDWNNCPGP